jgi:hypothetical protein
MFTTTRDVETAVAADTGTSLESEERNQGGLTQSGWDFTPSPLIQEIREKILVALGRQLNSTFVKKSRALYWDPSRRYRVVCTVSKRYSDQGPARYWYAFHPAWQSFLEDGDNGFFVLGCVDLNVAFALPLAIVVENREKLNTSETKKGTAHYYHIKIVEPHVGMYALQLPRTGETLSLEPYLVALDN